MDTFTNTETQSLWTATTELPKREALKGRVEVDVAIVGGGITGLTAALLLKNAGKSVAVLERLHISGGETANTTAHLTEVVDTRYKTLLSDFGKHGARLVAESSRVAIEHIERWVSQYDIDCDFARVPGFLYTESKKDLRDLRAEEKAMFKAGIEARLVDSVPLPFKTAGAIRVENQAQFHPRKYCAALAEQIHGDGSYVFEKTSVIDMQDGTPCHLKTENGSVVAKDVIFATNSVIQNRFLLQTKLAAYRTYAVAFKLGRKRLPPGLYWDTADPYHYTRVHGDYAIVGGEDHKTGAEEDTSEAFEDLEDYCREKYQVKNFEYRWSGQIIEPVDGLPYIGKNSFSSHFYIAVGYSGNGMTFGTIAGLLLSDLVLERRNDWAKLYDATRIKPLASLRTFVSENKDFPMCLVKDRIKPAETSALEDVKPGEGKIVSYNGQKVAVYHDENGAIHALSPVCTHMGCHVRFNDSEQSWDCPCHGSRFAPDGKVLNGPALTPLAHVDIETKTEIKKAAPSRKKTRKDVAA